VKQIGLFNRASQYTNVRVGRKYETQGKKREDKLRQCLCRIFSRFPRSIGNLSRRVCASPGTGVGSRGSAVYDARAGYVARSKVGQRCLPAGGSELCLHREIGPMGDGRLTRRPSASSSPSSGPQPRVPPHPTAVDYVKTRTDGGRCENQKAIEEPKC